MKWAPWLVVSLVACDRSPEVVAVPALPDLVLTAVEPRLRATLAAAPAAPNERRLAALLDLVVTAYQPGAADARFAEMAKRSLDDEVGVEWAFEVALGHADATVRSFAAFRLGELGYRPAIPRLLFRLKYEAENTVKVWVVAE